MWEKGSTYRRFLEKPEALENLGVDGYIILKRV